MEDGDIRIIPPCFFRDHMDMSVVRPFSMGADTELLARCGGGIGGIGTVAVYPSMPIDTIPSILMPSDVTIILATSTIRGSTTLAIVMALPMGMPRYARDINHRQPETLKGAKTSAGFPLMIRPLLLHP